MNLPRMTRLLVAFALLTAPVPATAQERHFLYLQTDNEQAFYLRIDGETRSSTAAGYLILPRLKDGPVEFVVGFPLRKHPEYRFRIEDLREDRGYALKDFGAKGWGLFDLMSLQVTYGERFARDSVATAAVRPPAPRDPFATVLASAIGDSSLMDAALVVPERITTTPRSPQPVVGDPTTAARKDLRDTAITEGRPLPAPDSRMAGTVPDSPTLVRVRLPEPMPAAVDGAGAQTRPMPATEASRIRKLLDFSDSTGLQVVYADPGEEGGLDTVAVWIPAVRPPADTAAGSIAASLTGRPLRTDCQGMVSVAELGQLRRRMEAIPDEDAKVAAALREFRLRCFTSEQVRSLLVVFLRDEGRYKLLDAAFPRVYDQGAFLDLQSVLRDSYFIHRFRRLVGLQ